MWREMSWRQAWLHLSRIRLETRRSGFIGWCCCRNQTNETTNGHELTRIFAEKTQEAKTRRQDHGGQNHVCRSLRFSTSLNVWKTKAAIWGSSEARGPAM